MLASNHIASLLSNHSASPKTPDLSTMPAATINSSTNAVVCPLIDDPNHIPNQMTMDNQFPLQDDANCDEPHDDSQYQVASEDYKQANFYAFVGPHELEQLCNPVQAIFTNTQPIKVPLLKILTELEAPLWAFKVIIDWACDAYQTG
jgi:hypothetical protein